MARQALEVLRDVFGFQSFRGQQAEIIDHVMGGGDGLVLMPTGGGKSLCYQIPALCLQGTAVVVSPLIALMQDQVEALRQAGVRAAALNSSIGYGEALAIERDLEAGELARRLRAAETPVFTTVRDQAVQVHVRTLQPGDEEDVAAALVASFA